MYTNGDLKNNLQKLQKTLRLMKYSDPIDFNMMISNDSVKECLKYMHYAWINYSSFFNKWVLDTYEVNLLTKTDEEFVKLTFKLLRDIFNVRVSINVNQFFSNSFVEQKIILIDRMLTEIRLKKIALNREKHKNKISLTVQNDLKKEIEKKKCTDETDIEKILKRLSLVEEKMEHFMVKLDTLELDKLNNMNLGIVEKSNDVVAFPSHQIVSENGNN